LTNSGNMLLIVADLHDTSMWNLTLHPNGIVVLYCEVSRMRDVDLYRDRGLLAFYGSAHYSSMNSNDLILQLTADFHGRRDSSIARRSWRSAEREACAIGVFAEHRENQIRVSVGIGNCWTQLNC